MNPIPWLGRKIRSLQEALPDDPCLRGERVPEAHRCSHEGCDAIPLREMRASQEGVVSCLEDPGSRTSTKLVAMGILPGTRIRLVQRYPAYVIRVGFTDLAVDDALAARIRVHPA